MLVCFEPLRRPLLALLLATSVTTYCTHGRAQSGQPDAPVTGEAAAQEERKASARAHYQEGAKAYSAGRYKDAVDLFLEADRLSPSAPLSFNVARAYALIGDDANALRWYRDYLRRAPTAENAADVKALVSALAAKLAQKGVQQLTVLSTPPGATVTIDGTPVGVTPWTGELTPSKHKLLLTYRGYTDERRTVTLSASEPRDIDLQMEQSMPDASAPAPAPTGQENTGPRFGPAPWISLGVGAAALGGALGFELARRSAESDAKHELTQLGYQSRLESEQSRQTTARVLAGVGFGLAAVGGVLLLLDSKTTQAPTANASFMCLPQLCAVSAESRF